MPNILRVKGAIALKIVPDANIENASRNHISASFVADPSGAVAGILSERDVAVALPRYGVALRETTVSEIMTVDVGFYSPEMSVKPFIDIMVTSAIRHLLALDGNKLRRVIWSRDVVGNWLGGIVNSSDGSVLMTSKASTRSRCDFFAPCLNQSWCADNLRRGNLIQTVRWPLKSKTGKRFRSTATNVSPGPI